ncbi:MAG: zinc ribbon domain-containing protein [Deltaproteobacteria bacterium]|nr:zinc ribbon domain-containing protein [Deltaproteobacteria bacterium]
MPIYEFKCGSCGREFEELVTRSGEKILCPDCGRDDCEKWMSSFRSRSGGGAGMGDFGASTGGGSSCGSCSSSSCAGCGSSH